MTKFLILINLIDIYKVINDRVIGDFLGYLLQKSLAFSILEFEKHHIFSLKNTNHGCKNNEIFDALNEFFSKKINKA